MRFVSTAAARVASAATAIVYYSRCRWFVPPLAATSRVFLPPQTCTHMCTCSYLCCIYMHICVQIYTCMYTYVYIDTYTLFVYVHTSQYSGSYFGWPPNPFHVVQTRFWVAWTRCIRRTSQFFFTRHIYLTMFPNIQDQSLHAMQSDTMDPRAMEGDVHLPEDDTKCKRKFTQMSISEAGYPSMEWYV